MPDCTVQLTVPATTKFCAKCIGSTVLGVTEVQALRKQLKRAHMENKRERVENKRLNTKIAQLQAKLKACDAKFDGKKK